MDVPPPRLPQIDIRPLRTDSELKACVALQRETWGDEFTDVVPPSILKVSQRIGGVAAGAFDESGQLLGFVYGLTGVEGPSGTATGGARIVHWSDMLAVRPEARNLGLGRRLKEFQRKVVGELGAAVIYWTYDPLVARNAHLNFNVFGVRVTEYVPEMYGQTDSPLHRGIGTDRFVVEWPVPDVDVIQRLAETHAAATNRRLLEAPILNAGSGQRDGGRGRREAGSGAQIGDRGRVEVPHDINALQATDPEQAAGWRRSTRTAIQQAFAAGLAVQGFVVDDCAQRGYYLLGK